MCLKAFVSIKKNRQIQADWNQIDPNAVSFIKNKPNVIQLSNEINTLNTNVASLLNEINTIKAKVSAIETNIGDMQNVIANLQGLCNVINERVEIQQLSIDDLYSSMNTVNTIKRDIIDIKERLTALESK